MKNSTKAFTRQMKAAAKVMARVLSPEMQAAIKMAKENGGKLMRYPGGYWANDSWEFNCGRPWAGTQTIAALVKRRKGIYTRRSDSVRSASGFPIEFTLHREATPLATSSNG